MSTTATTTSPPYYTRHDGQPPVGAASSADWGQNLSYLGLGYPSGMPMMCSNRAVRFDSECVLIPELHKSKRPLMVTKSYSLPLWKKRATSGESTTSNGEETSDHVPSSPPTTSTGAVVLKLPLPSFMAKPSRSRSRSKDCARPSCLVNPTIQDRRRSISPVRALGTLPNPIPVVEHTLTSLTTSSSSPTCSTFSETASSATGTRSPINRSPSVPHTSPNFLDAKASKEKEKDRHHHHEIVTIPLRQCCPDCFHITEESLRIGEHWEERFSRGARRRRGSSVSSATASESEGDMDPYSPMASYRPLRELVKQEAAKKLAEDNSNSNFGQSSAVADDDDMDDILAGVTPLSLAVRVDEVDRIKGSRFTKHPSPSVEHIDEVETEDEFSLLPAMEREREASSSSTGSAFSTMSNSSGTTSATSEGSAYNQLTARRILPSMPTPASTSTCASRPRRSRKPSTPINEEQEPPEEKYVGYCQDRVRGRSGRDRHRLKALKVKVEEDDDDDMLFPLPSPRRSPSISPLNTPNGSLTPTPGSKTPSPNPSPTASSSTVHLNAPKRRSKLRLDTGSQSSHEGSTSTLPHTVDEGAEADVDEKEPVLAKSTTRKEVESKKEKVSPPSIAKAAEIALAETQPELLTPQEEISSEAEWVNVRLRPKISGHSKVASEPTRGSLKEIKETSPRIPSFSHPAKPSSSSPSTSPLLNTSTPTQISRSPSSPSVPMSRPKPKRKTSLRSSAGAFLDIFRGVAGITP